MEDYKSDLIKKIYKSAEEAFETLETFCPIILCSIKENRIALSDINFITANYKQLVKVKALIEFYNEQLVYTDCEIKELEKLIDNRIKITEKTIRDLYKISLPLPAE